MSRGPYGEVHVVDDVVAAFADLVIAEAPASVALSGGETARDCYAAVAARRSDWSGVDVYYGDERWVPLDDPDSNAGMVEDVLLASVSAGSHHPMYQEGATVDDGAAVYGRLLQSVGPVDLVHLGLGPDGHTASLFPGTAALDETKHRVVVNQDALHPHPRLTVTYPWLATAELVVFTVAGEEKRDAYTAIRDGADLPAARVRAVRVVWLVDPAAAGR